MELLISKLEDHKNIFISKFSMLVTQDTKNKVWKKIAEDLKGNGYTHRSAEKERDFVF